MAIKYVLIVDDSATDRLYLKEILERNGFETEQAESAEKALEMLERKAPDLVLMDIVMPGMTGFEATRKIAKNPVTADIPVVICSGKASVTDRPWGLRMGAKECLVKPIAESDLLALIATLG